MTNTANRLILITAYLFMIFINGHWWRSTSNSLAPPVTVRLVPCMYDESLYMSRFSLGLNHYRLRTLHRQPTYKDRGP